MQRSGDILVVDDEVDIVNLVVDLLQDEGYHVRSASNGELALSAIARQQPALILMDMYMPQMTGLMFLEHLQARGITNIPVILMTASPRVAAPLVHQNLVDYLAKPFDITDLLNCVARHLGDDAQPHSAPETAISSPQA